MSKRGLLGEFSSASELSHEVWKAIEHDLVALSLAPPTTRPALSGVRFQVQPHQEREHTGFSKAGRATYTTRHWMDVTNVGDEDAQYVVFEIVGDSGLHMPRNDAPPVIHAGQVRRINVLRLMGGTDPEIIRIRWEGSDGEPREQDLHIG